MFGIGTTGRVFATLPWPVTPSAGSVCVRKRAHERRAEVAHNYAKEFRAAVESRIFFGFGFPSSWIQFLGMVTRPLSASHNIRMTTADVRSEDSQSMNLRFYRLHLDSATRRLVGWQAASLRSRALLCSSCQCLRSSPANPRLHSPARHSPSRHSLAAWMSLAQDFLGINQPVTRERQ